MQLHTSSSYGQNTHTQKKITKLPAKYQYFDYVKKRMQTSNEKGSSPKKKTSVSRVAKKNVLKQGVASNTMHFSSLLRFDV